MSTRQLVALFTLALATSACAGGRAETPSSAPDSGSASIAVATPSESPPVMPSATRSAAATPSASPAAEPALRIDAFAEVAVDTLLARTDPGMEAETSGSFARGTMLYLVAGPVEASGHDWYHVQEARRPSRPGEPVEPAELVWVAAGNAEEDYLAPAEPECARSVNATVVETFSSPEMLYCFGGEELTFRAWVPESSGLGGHCGCIATPEWLAYPMFGYILADEAAPSIMDETGWFYYRIDPASGLAPPDVHQWVEVTAHYDDPAAETCRVGPDSSTDTADERPWFDPDYVVVACRERLVVTSITPVSGP